VPGSYWVLRTKPVDLGFDLRRQSEPFIEVPRPVEAPVVFFLEFATAWSSRQHAQRNRIGALQVAQAATQVRSEADLYKTLSRSDEINAGAHRPEELASRFDAKPDEIQARANWAVPIDRLGLTGPQMVRSGRHVRGPFALFDGSTATTA
jgi:hypothetical protein